MMEQQGTSPRNSWLSLVAETAGVSGATVARVEIKSPPLEDRSRGNSVRAIIQITDDFGGIVGAGAWEGDAQELARGVTVDVGCDLGSGWGNRIVAWIQPDSQPVDPARALAPFDATEQHFDPAEGMRLMLRGPVYQKRGVIRRPRVVRAARAAAPLVAA